jgi:hypothetical protein
MADPLFLRACRREPVERPPAVDALAVPDPVAELPFVMLERDYLTNIQPLPAPAPASLPQAAADKTQNAPL